MRAANSYRGARRNACREAKQVWGPNWYLRKHSVMPRYVPWEGKTQGSRDQYVNYHYQKKRA